MNQMRGATLYSFQCYMGEQEEDTGLTFKSSNIKVLLCNLIILKPDLTYYLNNENLNSP